MNLCFQCRIKKGFKPKDNGAHTARRMKCDCCDEVRAILGDRHWVTEYPNGMTLQ